PERAAVIGGGAVGIDLAQFLARFGSRVTLVEGAERLAPREPEEIGDALAGILESDGIDVRLAARATSVRVEGGRRVVTLDDGSESAGEALVVAAGRTPRVHGIGLETVGIE